MRAYLNNYQFSYESEKSFLQYLWFEDRIDSFISRVQDIKDLLQDIARQKENLQRGNTEIRGKFYDWRQANPPYQSKEDWEANIRDTLEYNLVEIESIKLELIDIWLDFKKWTDLETGSFEDEVKIILKWAEDLNTTDCM